MYADTEELVDSLKNISNRFIARSCSALIKVTYSGIISFHQC